MHIAELLRRHRLAVPDDIEYIASLAKNNADKIILCDIFGKKIFLLSEVATGPFDYEEQCNEVFVSCRGLTARAPFKMLKVRSDSVVMVKRAQGVEWHPSLGCCMKLYVPKNHLRIVGGTDYE